MINLDTRQETYLSQIENKLEKQDGAEANWVERHSRAGDVLMKLEKKEVINDRDKYNYAITLSRKIYFFEVRNSARGVSFHYRGHSDDIVDPSLKRDKPAGFSKIVQIIKQRFVYTDATS